MAILVHNSAQNKMKQNSDRTKRFTFRMSAFGYHGPLGTLWKPWTFRHLFHTFRNLFYILDFYLPFRYLVPLGAFWIPYAGFFKGWLC